jgi:hypothetical protein
MWMQRPAVIIMELEMQSILFLVGIRPPSCKQKKRKEKENSNLKAPSTPSIFSSFAAFDDDD